MVCLLVAWWQEVGWGEGLGPQRARRAVTQGVDKIIQLYRGSQWDSRKYSGHCKAATLLWMKLTWGQGEDHSRLRAVVGPARVSHRQGNI